MSTRTAPMTECPLCHAEVPAADSECAECGAVFEPLEADAGRSAASTVAGSREKLLYYAGIALIVLGGPGLALGSWLHDLLRISFLNYNSFDVFGPMNRLVLALGLLVMIVGVVFLFLALRLTQPSETDVPA